MIRSFLILSVTFLSFITSYAQRNEVGLLFGTTYYLGDLNPSKQFFLTKPAGGIIYRYIFNARWALKLDGIYGTVQGDDGSFASAPLVHGPSHAFLPGPRFPRDQNR